VPGLNGFVGEFLTMLGAFQPHRRFVFVAVCGVVLGAIYLFWMFQRVMHGRPQTEITAQPYDMTRREAFVLVPLAIAMVWIGLAPNALLGPMEATVTASLNQARIVEAAPGPVALGQPVAAGASR
jgi:NADH-quinone oxidoreductase subunit M